MELAAARITGELNNEGQPGPSKIKHYSDVLYHRYLLISLVLIGLMTTATVSTILLLYQTAFDNEKTRLQEIVQSQVRMINAVTAFDEERGSSYPAGARAATIGQIVEAHKDQTTLGKTGEFLLAELDHNRMVFHLPSRHLASNRIPDIAYEGLLAEPMRRALSGKSGSVVDLDYRGEKVLAAYAPLPSLALGLVAKTDIAEVRAPYIKATVISVTLVTLIAILGHIPLRRFYQKSSSEHDQMEMQLRQAQKLEAVGHLAAGVAHEINTPTQFVGDNINFLKEACKDIRTLCNKYEQLVRRAPDDENLKRLKHDINDYKDQIDLDFLLEDIDAAIDQSIEGTERIASIVKAMKTFSHPGASEMESIDINQAIQSTITVASNEWKYVAELSTRFDQTLPQVRCFPGEINQTLLNLIINAAHAIEEKQQQTALHQKGTIEICTRREAGEAVISIEDNGCGIPGSLLEKIYDPFFTTKPVGKGTGQGLSIAYTVITHKHGGSLQAASQPGVGSRFEVRLPI